MSKKEHYQTTAKAPTPKELADAVDVVRKALIATPSGIKYDDRVTTLSILDAMAEAALATPSEPDFVVPQTVEEWRKFTNRANAFSFAESIAFIDLQLPHLTDPDMAFKISKDSYLLIWESPTGFYFQEYDKSKVAMFNHVVGTGRHEEVAQFVKRRVEWRHGR